MDDWNTESWNNFDDDESAAADDSPLDWGHFDDEVVTIKQVDTEKCPECNSSRCIQNYVNQWLFLCLDCFHQFYNS